jgi:N5-hydroxyornithine acetyltransferase
MPATIVRLPDGQNFTVTPVFAGLFFKSHELNAHHSAYPIGWTVVLHTEDDGDDDDPNLANEEDEDEDDPLMERRRSRGQLKRLHHIHSYTKPTLQNDSFFISSISNPSSNDYKPPASPTRQIALMVYITLYWYFHQAAPSAVVTTDASKETPDEGKPRGEWRINVKREGVMRGRNLIPKLERMGLLANMNSAVGTEMDDAHESWAHMFVSQRVFWQIPGRLFLFTLQPTPKGASSYPGSPAGSRPGSPVRNESPARISGKNLLPDAAAIVAASNAGGGSSSTPHSPSPGTPLMSPPLINVGSFPMGPYFSASHLPTYFPPPALQYTITNHARHPLRPKPPRMGEVFYTRYVPSVGQYLSFRVASLSPRPVSYLGPVGPSSTAVAEHSHLATLPDTSLLQTWMSKPRVSQFWGAYHSEFLSNALSSRHSFPVIAMWDGIPFGFFEVYWVVEDMLGRMLGGAASDWDRGFHVFIGEDWARGRAQVWISSMVHWILCADYRTMSVCIEPRIDNTR